MFAREVSLVVDEARDLVFGCLGQHPAGEDVAELVDKRRGVNRGGGHDLNRAAGSSGRIADTDVRRAHVRAQIKVD